MRSILGMLTVPLLGLTLLAVPGFAESVPLLDGHSLHGKVLDVTAQGLELEGKAPGGGTYTTKVSADHIDPHWWYARRDAALGDDVDARLELSVWAVEHGLFRQAKAQFEQARKLDPKKAADFHDHVVPGLREGIATDLVRSAHLAMDAGKLNVANQMLHAVITRYGDTHAATDARSALVTVQHRIDRKLAHLAHWEKAKADALAGEQADERRRITGPIVALIRQGNNIMAHMPPAAAQADAATHTRQAALEYRKALDKISADLKQSSDDAALVARLKVLQAEAHAGLVQSHVTAGDVYAATGNYTDALGQASALDALDGGQDDGAALRTRVDEAQSWSDDGIYYDARWAGRSGARVGGARR